MSYRARDVYEVLCAHCGRLVEIECHTATPTDDGEVVQCNCGAPLDIQWRPKPVEQADEVAA